MFGRRLADDAHEAWRFGSMRFMALGGVCQTVVVTCPAAVAQHVPEWAWQGLSILSVICMICAGISRVTVKDDHHEPSQPS